MASEGSSAKAYEEALQRAREIAAKLVKAAPPGALDASPPGSEASYKRPYLESPTYDEPMVKRYAGNSPGGEAHMAAVRAAQIAKQINAQLGLPSSAAPPSMPPMSSNSNRLDVFEYRIPDRLVGLVIGKGGEQISRIQSDSGCKVQIAPDCNGMPDRICTLTGNSESIRQAKYQLDNIVQKGQSVSAPIDPCSLPPGQIVIEMKIPGPKCGLVIGKGGETIKAISDRCRVKMVVIQDTNASHASEKPMRIIGEPAKAEAARKMVLDIINSKDGFGSGMYSSEYGGGMPSRVELQVPKNAIGLVIGKGGETIKKICNESCAKVQFKTDEPGPDGSKTLEIMGSPDAVQRASDSVNAILATTYGSHRGGGGGGGGGGDRGGGGGGGGDSNGGACYITIPADRAGVVIGKGGETIKEINRKSGAFVEICRDSTTSGERQFAIRGSPDQVQYAQSLINEKIYPHTLTVVQSNMGSSWGYQNNENSEQSDVMSYYQNYYYYQQQQQQHEASGAGAAAPGHDSSTAGTGDANQPDFSQQWIDYYRALGMHEQADAIQKHLDERKKQQPGGDRGAGPENNNGNGEGQQQLYDQQWQQYYAQIYAGGGGNNYDGPQGPPGPPN